MYRAKDFFETEVGSFWDTMMVHNGNAGYKIPEYQRQYNWDEDHLKRLLVDSLNGFSRLAESTKGSSGPEYTFLGSIILVRESRSEPSFDGVSLSVVDGQQRLTSLILTSCALFQMLKEHRSDISELRSVTADWLKMEINGQLIALQRCVLGKLESYDGSILFPRMIRSGDRRGETVAQSENRSAIGIFLEQFAEFTSVGAATFEPKQPKRETPTWDTLTSNYGYICQQLKRYLYRPEQNDLDTDDVSIVQRTAFGRAPINELFRRREIFQDESERNRSSSELTQSPTAEGLVRLLLFASYLTQRVVLTRVEASNEADAFDIFDALNTTGEPLTALETCKPLIIQSENKEGTYLGSESEYYWSKMESGMADAYSEPAQLQTEIRHLLTSFALYFDGKKLPLNLKDQRVYLRNRFQGAEKWDQDSARNFVRSFSEFTDFRLHYWDKNTIDRMSVNQYRREDLEVLKLCLRFISDMNTALAVPILARYWVEYGEDDKDAVFVSATKAVTAFLVLRRSATGGTERIDSDFRSIMKQGSREGGDPLCMGPLMTNEILSVEALRKEFRAFLKARRIGVQDKSSWIERAKEIEFGNRAPQPLCRFLLLAAAHHTRPDKSHSGLLTKENTVSGSETDFFNHRTWVDEKYATVEHIAPDAGPNGGWKRSIYSRPATRHTIGNLILLPERENRSIGNAGWDKKKIFYRALSARTTSDRQEQIELASSQGLEFGGKTRALLESQEYLSLLDPLAKVENWNVKLIEERTKNILGLAWEQIKPWLYD